MSSPITKDLGQFIAALRFQQLPAEAVRVAKLGILDTVGVMIAGRSGAPQLLLETLDPSEGDATVLFSSRRAPALDAALINGAAAHGLDYDDVAMRGHPSSVIVPALLAEGESLGASGEDLITAYVAGYETWAELTLRDPDPQHLRGWHYTGWIGAIAAAAACANLRRLTAEPAARSLAIAASESAGLMVNNGTMTKGLHAGRAAQSGLLAARLADRGFSAAPDGLEHPFGWLQAISSGGRVDLETPVRAGEVWRITELGLAIRRYPVCYLGHRLYDGMLALIDRTGIKPADVLQVRAGLGRSMCNILRYHRPENASQAKFSAEFGLAAALLRGRITLAEVNDDFVRSEAVQALMGDVLIEPIDEQGGSAVERDQVRVRTRDGAELFGGPIEAIIGSPERPLSFEDLRAKFEGAAHHGAAQSAPPGVIAGLFAQLNGLELLADVRQLRAFSC